MTDNEATEQRRMLVSALMNLNLAARNLHLYGAGHPIASQWVSRCVADLGRLLLQRPRVALKMVEGDLVFEGGRLSEDITSVSALAEAFSAHGVESVTFLRGVKEKEIADFVALLGEEPEFLEEGGGIAEEMRAQGLSHIVVEDLHYLVQEREKTIGEAGEGGIETGGLDLAAREVYLSALGVVKDTATQVRAGQPVETDRVVNLARNIVDQVLKNESGLTALASIKTYDEYTFQHCVNLSILSLALGSRIGLNREQLVELGICAILHDMGKIFVPMELMRKPGKLDDGEWALMEKHPVDGARVLAVQPGLPLLAPVVAFEHHLKNDLSGYPRGSRRKGLSLYSSAVAVADTYDALTTSRPYREPLSPKQALEVLRESGETDYEPRLLERFTEVLGPHPVGSCVRLGDGRVAVVTRMDSRPPFGLCVAPVLTSEGQPILEAEELQLGGEHAHFRGEGRDLLETVEPAALGIDVQQVIANAHGLAR